MLLRVLLYSFLIYGAKKKIKISVVYVYIIFCLHLVAFDVLIMGYEVWTLNTKRLGVGISAEDE